jgi:PAS domain S-box-containing protein
MRCKNGNYKWVRDRGMVVSRDAGGKPLRMIGTHTDIDGYKRTEARIAHLNKLYRALSACNMAIVYCRTREELFARICEVVVEEGGMAMAWVGLLDEASGRIVPTVWHGQGTDYLDGIEVTAAADDPHGRGPTGTAVRENRPAGFENFASNPATAPWHARGARFGWRHSAAVPICRDGRPIGALTFYTTTGDWFDQEMMRLMQEMANDLGFALDKLDAEQEAATYQRTLRESEERYRLLVEQSIAGAIIFQNGQIIYANPRMAQILGYPAAEDIVGRSPQSLVAPKDLDQAVDVLQQLVDGRLKHINLSLTMLRKDGTTTEVGITGLATVYQAHPAVIGLLQDISDKQVAEEQIRRYARQLEHTFIQTVRLTTTLSEMRDPYTSGHEQRVAEIAVAIGREMGLDDNRLEGLRIGGYLHDVGKVSVPIEILVKPTHLTDSEYALVKAHPQAGYEVLKNVDFPWPVAQIALQHHERIDGSGYPQGLRGEAILLEARIVAVADVVESMASHRPYRPGLGLDKALAEVEHGSGTAYDAEVVAACLRLFREKGFVIPD